MKVILIFSIFAFFLSFSNAYALSGDIAPLGNPDGKIDIGDAVVVARMVAGLVPADLRADVAPLGRPDGEINIGDAVVVARAVAGLVTLSQDSGSQTANLVSFTSAQQLHNYLKSSLAAQTYPIYEGSMLGLATTTVSIATTAAAPTSANAKSSDSSSSYSTTNIQEKNVDEADIFKFDGRYLYLSSNPSSTPTSVSIPVMAMDTVLNIPEPTTSNRYSSLRILELQESPAKAQPLGSVPLQDFKQQITGMYFVNQRENKLPDLLVSVHGNNNNFWSYWWNAWWPKAVTEVGLFDISDREHPKLQARLTLDGTLYASRRIGDTLYLVSRFAPNPVGYLSNPYTLEDQGKNKQLLEQSTLTDLLPQWQVNNGDKKPLLTPESCSYSPDSGRYSNYAAMTVITAIPLSTYTSPSSVCFIGTPETVYLSTENLYLATTSYNNKNILSDVKSIDVVAYNQQQTTSIHKFSLTDAGPVYGGSGSVSGHLGSEPDKMPFRMSEYQGALRVATSVGQQWNSNSSTLLTILQPEDATAKSSPLRQRGQITGIGRPGERLYSVRFVGNRGYLVTFRVTDPLYVLDLSDPTQPKFLGELHIDGYSDYLHPFGETRLLGIGKDAVTDEQASDMGGRGAWYQGVKVALFDVADPAKPQLIQSQVIGKRGTTSDLLLDHHAMAMLSASDGRSARLALPISLHDTLSSYYSSYSDPSKPWYYYDWTHTGLYLFDVDLTASVGNDKALQLTSKMIVSHRDASQSVLNNDEDGRNRAIIFGTSVYFINHGRVWSGIWGTETGAQPENP